MKWIYVSLAFLVVSCKQEDQSAALKAEAREAMQAKVQAVIDQVKADCDSNLYNLARYRADSIKMKRNLRKIH